MGKVCKEGYSLVPFHGRANCANNEERVRIEALNDREGRAEEAPGIEARAPILTNGSATWVCHSCGLLRMRLLSVSRISAKGGGVGVSDVSRVFLWEVCIGMGIWEGSSLVFWP